MNKFITLHDSENNNEILINIRYIISITTTCLSNTTIICLTDKTWYTVKETPGMIITLLTAIGDVVYD